MSAQLSVILGNERDGSSGKCSTIPVCTCRLMEFRKPGDKRKPWAVQTTSQASQVSMIVWGAFNA